MNFSFRKKITFGFISAIALVGFVSFSSYQNAQATNSNAQWVARTHEVQEAIESFLSSVKDMETGQRGFVITQSEEYLEPYTVARPTILSLLARLKSLTADNASQQERLASLQRVTEEKMAELDRVIQVRRHQGFERARDRILGDVGKIKMDAIRALGFGMMAEEGRLLQIRTEANAASIRSTLLIIEFGGGLAIVVLLGALLIINLSEKEREKAAKKINEQSEIQVGLLDLSKKMSGELAVPKLCANIIDEVAGFVNAQVGAIYLAHDGVLKRLAGFAFPEGINQGEEYPLGVGLVGEVARRQEPMAVSQVPTRYHPVTSGLGSASPSDLYLVPLVHENETKGVIELGKFTSFDKKEMEFLQYGVGSMAVAIHSAQIRTQVKELLTKTKIQAEELSAQQEELKAYNEELQVQQDGLRQANQELEEQRTSLEEQKEELERRNQLMGEARRELEQKAKALQVASGYKSEFLANMSHELRTPLNSILLLSKSLAKNNDHNLSNRQIEASEAIYASGNDLLNLINDILDLSKVEAGKLELTIQDAEVAEIAGSLRNTFQPLMEAKGLGFQVEVAPDAPTKLATDRMRLEQVLKNFLSNALKFTQAGEVRLKFAPARVGDRDGLRIAVSDTGIGIPAGKLESVFRAFEQGDSSISRRFGGTGLGLTIARELAGLLGGHVELASEENHGSEFAVVVPLRESGPVKASSQAKVTSLKSVPPQTSPAPLVRAAVIEDDRASLAKGDRTILVIEDDIHFARILKNICHDRGFKCLMAVDGEAGLADAKQFIPDAILLDLRLPGVSGVTILASLKSNLKTRHIPIHVLSVDDKSMEVLKMGAFGFLTKPVDREKLDAVFTQIESRITKQTKRVLVVEDRKVEREAIEKLIASPGVTTVGVESGALAVETLQAENFDCMVLDLKLADMSGFDLLTILSKHQELKVPPVIVYTSRDLTRDELDKLRMFSESIIIKGARSEELLFDEVSLFLHKIASDFPEEQQQILERVRHREDVFDGKKLLIVDDDMRNVFALRSVLQDKGFQLFVAKTGKEALQQLEQHPDMEMVLMDVMMPEMDGLEATRRMRSDERFKKTPVIALTAKAMKGDREKCVEAGANDYLAKPIDADNLLSLLRVWMTRKA